MGEPKAVLPWSDWHRPDPFDPQNGVDASAADASAVDSASPARPVDTTAAILLVAFMAAA